MAGSAAVAGSAAGVESVAVAGSATEVESVAGVEFAAMFGSAVVAGSAADDEGDVNKKENRAFITSLSRPVRRESSSIY